MTLEITLEEPDGCRRICMPVAVCHIIGGYLYWLYGQRCGCPSADNIVKGMSGGYKVTLD
jgi:hypothetical protein